MRFDVDPNTETGYRFVPDDDEANLPIANLLPPRTQPAVFKGPIEANPDVTFIPGDVMCTINENDGSITVESFNGMTWVPVSSNATTITDYTDVIEGDGPPPESVPVGMFYFDRQGEGPDDFDVRINALESQVVGLRHRNFIHNGDGRVYQRAAGVSGSGGTTLRGPDRWLVANGCTATTHLDINTIVSQAYGRHNYIRQWFSVAAGASGAGDFSMLGQVIEGFDIAPLMWGTPLAKPITLSFLFQTYLAGTYSVSLRNATNDRSYVATFDHPGGWAEVRYNIVIPGCTTGTWRTDNGMGVQVYWCAAAGTNYRTSTPNTWLNANAIMATGSVQHAYQTASSMSVCDVQVEVGDTATPYEIIPYAEALAICQRYFYRLNASRKTNALLGYGWAASSTVAFALCALPVDMRAVPTHAGQSGTINCGDGQTPYVVTAGPTVTGTSTERFVEFYGTVGGNPALTIYRPLSMYFTNGGYLDLTAEF